MRIEAVEIDEGNEEHLTRHGVSAAEVYQALTGDPEVRRNRGQRTATHLAMGRTTGGRRLVVAFVDQGGGTVRPITAWEASK